MATGTGVLGTDQAQLASNTQNSDNDVGGMGTAQSQFFDPSGQLDIASGPGPGRHPRQHFIPFTNNREPGDWGKPDWILDGARRYPGVSSGAFMPQMEDMNSLVHQVGMNLGRFGSLNTSIGAIAMMRFRANYLIGLKQGQMQNAQLALKQYELHAQQLADQQAQESQAYGEAFALWEKKDPARLEQELRGIAHRYNDHNMEAALSSGGKNGQPIQAAKDLNQWRDNNLLPLQKANLQRQKLKEMEQQAEERRQQIEHIKAQTEYEKAHTAAEQAKLKPGADPWATSAEGQPAAGGITESSAESATSDDSGDSGDTGDTVSGAAPEAAPGAAPSASGQPKAVPTRPGQAPASAPKPGAAPGPGPAAAPAPPLEPSDQPVRPAEPSTTGQAPSDRAAPTAAAPSAPAAAAAPTWQTGLHAGRPVPSMVDEAAHEIISGNRVISDVPEKGLTPGVQPREEVSRRVRELKNQMYSISGTGDEFVANLKKFDPKLGHLVEMAAHYDIPLATGQYGGTRPITEDLEILAKKANPNFDAGEYERLKNLTSPNTQSGRQIRAAPQLSQSITQVLKALSHLPADYTPPQGWIDQIIADKITGDPEWRVLGASIRNYVYDIVRTQKGSSPTIEDVRAELNLMGPSAGARAIIGVMKSDSSTVYETVNAANEEFRTQKGITDPNRNMPFFNAKANDILGALDRMDYNTFKIDGPVPASWQIKKDGKTIPLTPGSDLAPGYQIQPSERVGMRPTPDEVQRLPRPSTREEAMKLDPGTLFIRPNGTIGQVPSAQPAKQPSIELPQLEGR